MYNSESPLLADKIVSYLFGRGVISYDDNEIDRCQDIITQAIDDFINERELYADPNTWERPEEG